MITASEANKLSKEYQFVKDFCNVAEACIRAACTLGNTNCSFLFVFNEDKQNLIKKRVEELGYNININSSFRVYLDWKDA